jgi:hypothetical protein
MTTYSRSGSQINVVKLDDLNSPPLVFEVPSEVTSLQFCTVAGRSCILAAAWRLGYTSLLLFHLDGTHENALDIPIHIGKIMLLSSFILYCTRDCYRRDG